VADGFNGVGADGASIGLWKTTNAWDAVPTWTAIAYTAPIPAGGYCGTQCWYDNDLKVDPTSADVLYAGGLSMWKFDGTVWSDVLHGMHVDQQSMAWVGTRLIAGNDGGLWSSTNGGTSWTNHNAGLQITQFYYGSIHPGEVAFAIAGSQDNGTEKWNGTTPWSFYYFGDGATTAIAKNNPTTHWAVSSQYLDIRHTMTGTFPSAAKAGIDPTNAPFISRFEKCPGNDDVFIAGTDNLWKTTNFFTAGVTWSSNGPDIGAITALTFAPSDPTCSTYVYSANGLLQLTTDGGTTWTNPDPFSQLPYRYVTDLGFDPTDANVLLVTFSGFDGDTPSTPGHLFRTANALSGTPTWSNISPPVNLPHNTVAIDPSAPSSLFAGTDIGVWWTPNLGTDWYQMGPSAGMPNVAVFDLQISDSGTSVIAFTHGRGAFLLGGPQPPPPSFELDHYKCYQGTDLKNPKLERVSSTLNDQITTEVVLLQKLKYLCTPVDMNGENINDPTAHLTCYQVKGETLSPRPQVQLSSQFQASKFELKKPKLLCVPSTKTVLP
jgi:hypothetical protein